MRKEKKRKSKSHHKAAILNSESHISSINLYLLVFITESLVWFQASGFYYAIDGGLQWAFFLAILLLSCVVEILQLWVCGTSPFSHAPAVYKWIECWVGQVITWFTSWQLQSWSVHQFTPVLATRMSSPALPLLIHPCSKELKMGPVLLPWSPIPTPTEPALLCCLDKL